MVMIVRQPPPKQVRQLESWGQYMSTLYAAHLLEKAKRLKRHGLLPENEPFIADERGLIEVGRVLDPSTGVEVFVSVHAQCYTGKREEKTGIFRSLPEGAR